MLESKKLEIFEKKVLSVNLALLILAIAILPYIFFAFFSVPSADDFDHAKISLDLGIFGFVKSRYLEWSGRYSSDFLIALYNVTGHIFSKYFLINFYYLVPLFLIIFCVATNYWFLEIIIDKNQFRYKLIYAMIATISVMCSTELRSTFYWLAGGVAYTLANSLFIISVAITIYLLYIKPINYPLFLVNLLLIPFINGLSESIMVSHSTFILSICILDTIFLKNIERNILWKKIAFSVFAIISSFVVYLAPGNTTRVRYLDLPEGRLALVIIRSFTSIVENIFVWINPLWISLVVLTVILSHKFLTNQSKIVFRDKKIFGVIITSLLISFYMSYFMRWHSIGGEGPLRSNSTSYTIFFLITFFSSLYFSYILNWDQTLESKRNKSILLAVITLFSCFSFTANAPLLKHEFGVLKSHYQYYQTNYPLIINAEDNSEIELPPEPRVEIVRWKCYLTDNKEYGVNEAFAKYFNLKSVVSVGGGSSDPDNPLGNGECK